MKNLNLIGYISLIAGVVLLAVAFTAFNAYEEGNLMLENFFCSLTVCFSRADIFFPVFVIGYILLALGLALLGDHIINNLMRLIFGR